MSPNVMVDRISVLPHDIIDSILTRLEIKEAARTCILSRSWRYQWHFLSKVNINYEDFCGVSDVEFVRIVDHILFNCGSVDELELHDIDIDTHEDIDRWILYVSRTGVKKLVIDNCAEEEYNITSCLFSCSDLTCLKLSGCMVKPLAAFKEFGNLTKLSLYNVTIDSQVLENVINSCPLLSQLSLEEVEPPLSLKINAPKLVILRMCRIEHLPRLMDTPLLDSAYFALRYYKASTNKDCKIIEFLGSMPILRRLELNHGALQHLAVGDVPACLQSVCPIEHLILSICFADVQELLVAFCIFRSSPFIKHLEIKVSSNKVDSRICSDGFWKGEPDLGIKFDHLQTVIMDFLTMDFLTGTECELKFIELLLSKAPALKTMNIYFPFETEDRSPTVRELIRFPRISPNAQVILK